MCGIIGYLGKREAYHFLLKGLKDLEYRGYDSAGIALLDKDLSIYKKKGKVEALEEFTKNLDLKGKIGIGHTRWATHGKPTDVNSHPHASPSRNLVIIHNGIIENHEVLKKELIHRGHFFESETDTEVLIHLIEEIQIHNDCSLERATQLALQRVEGAYAIIVLSKNDPEKLVAARKSSPLVIGLADQEYFIASDATVLGNEVNKVVYLDDEQIAICRSSVDLQIKTLEDISITPFIEELDMKIDVHQKDGYDHYMLKEIFEQPKAISNCLSGKINALGQINLSGIIDHAEKFKRARRIIIVSCGTSWHAGLVGEYMLEKHAKLPVEVEYASEFRYREPLIYEDDIVLCISQSGETADSLAALEIAKAKGAFTFGICNVVGSSISRNTDAGIYTKAGSEIGVASTKAFTAQLSVLAMMAIQIGVLKGHISRQKEEELLLDLLAIPELIRQTLKCNYITEAIAECYKNVSDFMYLGRGINFPIALEGALKMKEISYIHSEGYPAAEMKHGPIALVDEKMPVVVVANNLENYKKVVSNIEEIKARSGQVIAIVCEGDEEVFKLADAVIEVPPVSDFLSPFLSVVPLQLLSYHVANKLEIDVDRPRNLAKSVTVE